MARKTSRRELDSPTKNQIIGALIAGITVAQAARLFGVPDSTIRSLKNKYEETGSTHNLPRSGRPMKLSPRARRHMLIFALKNDCLPWRDVAKLWSPKVSRTTAFRVLLEEVAKRRKMREVPFISKANRRARQAFA